MGASRAPRGQGQQLPASPSFAPAVGGHPASDGLGKPNPDRHFQGFEKHEGDCLITHACEPVLSTLRPPSHLHPPAVALPAQASFPSLLPRRRLDPARRGPVPTLLRPRARSWPWSRRRCPGRGAAACRQDPGPARPGRSRRAVRTGRPAAPRLQAPDAGLVATGGGGGRNHPAGGGGFAPRGRLGWSGGGAGLRGPSSGAPRSGRAVSPQTVGAGLRRPGAAPAGPPQSECPQCCREWVKRGGSLYKIPFISLKDQAYLCFSKDLERAHGTQPVLLTQERVSGSAGMLKTFRTILSLSPAASCQAYTRPSSDRAL